jgi:prevent-host-death family protein
MSDPSTGRERVGVRELRQNLSVYLDRVKAGETLEVTEHGHAVGLLTPLPRTPQSTLERLIAEGRVTPGAGDLLAYLRANPPVRSSPEPTAAATPAPAPASGPPPEAEPTMAQILQQMRGEADR